ncbi:hypothetical protein GC105_06870 [Alkalibaculum sp. M08DMB]|uniref:Uncharacterized protein n=1 Tax=Alkalibaculum sporogenes TaxID=2655001 RepID=A0A6A7K8I5_9FIRM|nr:hypothetical protein [Alkalibaculum sporogenes]MPW25507.1 hypothetical protein [Alkalibaculum sporogenes]
MKLPLTCFKCMDDKEQFMLDLLERKLYSVTINDSGIYKMTCDRGHTSYTMLQNEKFEILFDMGIYAFQDGYYRESISSFVASLERFYEYSIRLFCTINKIDDDVVSSTWKNVSAQSERQFGAYCFLYLLIMGEPPKVIANKYTTFRNKVIHKGYIPNENETVEYAKVIYDFIMNEIIKYQSKYGVYREEMTFKRLLRLHNEAQEGMFVNVATSCLSTSLSLTPPINQFPPFDEVIKNHRNEFK